MSTSDPFTQVERLLWFILESHPGFADRVLPGNRIKLFGGGDATRIKDGLQTADVPEVFLFPAGGTGQWARTTSGEGFIQRWDIRCSTGKIKTEGDEYRALQVGLHAMRWELVLAFSHWSDVFPGFPFVRSVDLIPFTDTADDDTNRSVGWVLVSQVAVSMHWPNMEIQRWP